MKKHRTLNLLIALVALGVAAGGALAAPLEITYWRHNSPVEVNAMRALIQKFEAQNKDIKVILRTFPYSVYKTKLVATLSTDEGPDIINIHDSWAYSYIKAGLVTPVPREIITEEEIRAEFFPLINSFSEHGVYYGIPLGATNLALFYNKRLFKEAGIHGPPETWGALKTSAKRLTQYDRAGRIIQSGAAIGLASGQGWNYLIEALLRQAGVPVISDDLKSVGWESAAGVEVLDWFVGFITQERIYSHLLPGEYDAFRLELAAMMISGSFQIGQLAQVAPDLDYGVAPLPLGPKGIRASYGSLWGNCVTRIASPAARAASWRFILFLSAYENQKLWSHETGELPMRYAVLKDQAFQRAHPQYAPFIEQLPHSYASVKKDETAYKRAIIEAVEQMIYNDMSAKEALGRAAKSINAMLSKR